MISMRPTRHPIEEAVEAGGFSDVKQLLDSVPIHKLIREGAPIDQIEKEVDENKAVNTRSPCGKSPLMTAAYYCRKDVIEMLVRKGAVVNAMDEVTGDTPSHYVTLSLSGHIRQCACLMTLIESGADLTLTNNDGYNVFELATKNGNHDIGDTGNAMLPPPTPQGSPERAE